MDKDARSAMGKPLCDTPLVSFSLDEYNRNHPNNKLRIVAVRKDQNLHSRITDPLNTEGCQHFVKGRPLVPSISADSKAMYYHWHNDFMQTFWTQHKENLRTEDNVILLGEDPKNVRDGLFHMFGLVSRHECYRYMSDLPDSTCFLAEENPVKTGTPSCGHL